MMKVYKPLTDDQKKRGVIFSSKLIPNGTLHEVMGNDPDKDAKKRRLLNDSFFNNSPYRHNEIRR